MEMKKIGELLDEISRGHILLPEFQRGYVWNRVQVRGLMQSLYHEHPTGHLLIWRTIRPPLVRGNKTPDRGGHSLLLLDGQQRLTTLYVLFKGEAPQFYEGERLFFDLHFNMQTEEFRFREKMRMSGNPAWIGVHEFLREGLSGLLQRLSQLAPEERQVIQDNLAQLSRLDSIRNYTYAVDQLSDEKLGVDEVVDIFNHINSKGTPLKVADLAMAHVCRIWPEARDELRTFQAAVKARGFDMGFDFYLRCLAGVASESVVLKGKFLKTPADSLQTAWAELRPAFENLIDVLRQEAFISHGSHLSSHNVLIAPTVFLATQGGHFPDAFIQRRFIRWILLAGLWGRYSGATETKLQQDVALVLAGQPDPTPELEEAILRERGRVTVESSDLAGARVSSGFARMSDVVARSHGARDWFTGIVVHDPASGQVTSNVRHQIFSHSVLAKAGLKVDKTNINELANRIILARKAPADVRSLQPADYLGDVHRNQPGALQAQSVPMDRRLWEPQNFTDFLVTRRTLLARSINDFLQGLLPTQADPADAQGVRAMMASGESAHVEFKSSLRWDRGTEGINKRLEQTIVKTVAGFLNAEGGTILIGVDDSGGAVGIEVDYDTLKKEDRDGFELHLRQMLESRIDGSLASYLTVTFHRIDECDVCQINIDASDHPVYVDEPVLQGGGKLPVFYVRSGNATKTLTTPETLRFVQRRWAKTA